MNISETFIRRPIATSLLMAAIALFGVVAYRGLAISDLPAVEYPTINVNANLPGGDPVTMAASVASPLERQFTTIAGVDEMTSRSGTGSSNVTLTFDLDRNIDSAITDVQTAISSALPLLPPTLTAPPSFRKMNPADQPILQINLTSASLDMTKVDEYAEDLIAPRISMVNGVSQVTVRGSAKYAVRVQVDPERLEAQKIGFNEIDTALQNWNVTQPTGQLYGPAATYSIVAKGQLNNADEFKEIVVAYRRGRPVRLYQVANVLDSIQSLTSAAWYITKDFQRRAITLEVQKQPGTNVIEVTDAVRAVLPALEAQLPPSVHLGIRQDRSVNIRRAFGDIQITMLITLALVVGVIYLFLHNGSATVIPALALPFSILGTFAVMKVMDYSLDNLSMMALILCVGFVVDDAIVMLENAVRHIERGESPLEAALKGSKEIGFTIVTMTISLSAVFIPILFMGGILGRLFREFAVTITAAVLISGIVSITLTPMLCSRFLRVVHRKVGLAGFMDRSFARLTRWYGVSLRWVLVHRRVMLVVFAGVIAATVGMFGIVPKGFIPDTDNDSLNVNLNAAQGTSYYQGVQYAQKVADLIRQNPYVDAQMVNIGGGPGGGGPGLGNFNVQLVPRAQRSLSAQQIAQQLRGPLGRFPGFRATVNVPASLQIGGFRGNSNFNINVQSLNYDDLFLWAPRLEEAIAQIPEVQDVSDNMELKSPRVNMTIDRDRAAAAGLNATQITQTLSSGFGQRLVGTIYGERTQYRVILEIDPKYQERPESLKKISFRTSTGGLVPLEEVMSIKEDVGPQSVNHYGQLPAVNISFGLKPGASLGAAIDHVKEAARRVLPATVTTSLQGSAKVFQDSLSNLSLLFFISIGVVYIVLGMLYESYIHPITILSGLPSAALGGLVTLYLFGNELNIYSFVGLILLIGLVMKNAIMQIDFALDAERQRSLTPTEAIYEGCIVRFRPIMMTRMATMLGAMPIALGFGSGGEARQPLGLAVVGGLIVSQIITLYLTPVVYTYMATWVKTTKIQAIPADRECPPPSAKPTTARPRRSFAKAGARRGGRGGEAPRGNELNISQGFITRPIATSLLMAAIALFGMVAYQELPVSDLPNVDFPTLLVSAQLPGASPETMGASVATPLENQFSTISGLEQMTSVNSLGSTQITLEFALNRSLDGAAVDVQGAITQASRLLPQGMPTPPVFTKVNPADQPILYLVVSSTTLTPWTLDEFTETRIAQRISQVSGVAQVQILGGQKYAMHAQLDPHALAARQIGINEVEAALRNWNVNVPTGSIVGPHQVFTLQASGQLMNADEYRNQIISYRNGAPVRLEQLGTIVDGVEDPRTASWYYNKDTKQRSITLGIQRQPGTNTIAVADAVKALLPQFRAELPASVHMDLLYDRSDTIRESYHDVQFTMALTLGLVILVIFIFLRNVWATVIPSLALPFSIIGTFAAMYFLDYSLDNLSMMALILSVGFVVDDAIVMLENIYRHLEMGKDPLQAALVGSREIGFTIVSMTLSLAAVFIPVLFMGGVLGRLFREFSVTICVAILISGVVSVTLTPMLCSRFLKKPHKHGEGKASKLYHWSELAFQKWLNAYDRTLQIVMRHRPATMAAFVLVLVATGLLFIVVPKGFIPDQDASQILVITEAAQGTAFPKLVEYQDRVAEIIRANPNVEGLVSTIGGSASTTLGGPNLGQLVVTLKPRNERPQSVDEVIHDLRPPLDSITGMFVYLQNPPTIRIGSQVSKSLYQYSMQSPDTTALYATSRQLRSELAELPGLQDVTSDLMVTSPQVRVDIDRDKAASLGVTAAQIEGAFYDAYGPRWVSTIYGAVNEYKVLLELAPEFQQDPSALSLLYFKGAGQNAAVVPLDTLAAITQQVGPQTVNHYGQLPAVTVSFGLAPGASLGDVLTRVREVAERVVPDGVTGQFQGAAAAFEGALSNLAVLLIIAVLVVYIVLGILYESYIHPLTILSGLPSAAFGALLTLIVFGMDLNIYAFVGMIMLIGIVEKNAIMQIDFAIEAERSGMSSEQAIYQGCLIRFRPIMMTTMAALLGAVPIALGMGAGGEARQPLGMVVVGGLLFSQLVTLYLTPVFFTYMAQLQARLGRSKAKEPAPVVT